jgi:predicted  nucleic acid-binding Zn-ribbon protein
MTLGKVSNFEKQAKDIVKPKADFEKLNKILKNKEINLEKMKNIVVLQA